MSASIHRLTGLLESYGVAPSLTQQIVHGFALGIDRAQNGTSPPLEEGLTKELTKEIGDWFHDRFHVGHDCLMGELQAGDIIMGLGHGVPFNTTIVLKNDRKERTLRLGRPYGNGSGYGWTGQTMNTSAEVYTAYYSVRPTEQNTVKVIGKDTSYIESRKLVYGLQPLGEVQKAWYLIYKTAGKEAPNHPTNEWELRQKTWELEYSTFFGTDVKGIHHLPLELLEMD